MSSKKLPLEDYWRTIILYGRNESTYKIALGRCLMNFVEQDKTNIKMNELAEEFFNLYVLRLKENKPQLNNPARRTVMERIIEAYHLEQIDRTTAIERVENEAFNDVIPRFHNIYRSKLPINFYEQTESGLILTDQVFRVFEQGIKTNLEAELDSRWSLLEAAFEMNTTNHQLVNDIRRFYIEKGYKRTNITHMVPVLNGYQQDRCFYCLDKMNIEEDVHVDHVIPRQVLHHDQVWNLVLTHGFCNEHKTDHLPRPKTIKRLIQRNEYFINSNHPIRKELIAQLGTTKQNREKKVWKVYDDAKVVLRNYIAFSDGDPENNESFRTARLISEGKYSETSS